MRRLTGILFAFTLGWALLTGVSAANADTTVSLTFDDGNADQMPAVQMLTDHGMHGTFYIIPGRVDRPNSQYMTWANVQTIFAAGNEIGGHTQNHLHLPTLPASQQQSEICGGRDSLLAKGYPQISFAYPFGDHDSTSEQLVQQCGYLSGRGVGGLRDTGEPDADTIPPRNPWVLPTPGSIDIDDTLPDIKQWIMDAEAAGAGGHSWINLVIHHLCDPHVTDCSDPDGVDDAYITPQDFDSLLDWLQARELTGTHVERVEDVMTGQTSQDTTPPTSSIQCNGATCSSGFYNPSVSVKLFGTDTGGSGLKSIHYTTDGSTPDASDPSVANGGSVAIGSTTTIKFRAEDNAGNLETATNSKTIQIDSAKPTSSIQCNGSACSTSFYNAPVSATLSGSDTGGSGLKGIHYTTDGSTPDASDPSVANGGSVAINSTTTLKFRAEDNAGNLESSTHTQAISVDTAKPTSSIQCNGSSCASGFYNATVSATLSGSDTGGSGFKNIRYTTDGSAPTGSSAVYTAAIPVTSTTTIKWRAEDNAGNVESNQSQTITIDKATPTSSVQCNGAACSSGFYNGSVTATLSGTDTGGSGLKSIHYTTDGSTPDASDPSVANGGSVPISSTTTIKFRAEDNAGNIETATNSQTIQVDTAKPTSSIQCNGTTCQSSFYNATVSATLSGNDTGGSGLKNIRYTTDGSNPTSSSPVYSAAIPVSSTTTLKWRAEDNAGNVESPVHSQLISIDTAKPTSSIQCDGAACAPSYDHAVEATLSGSDTGGSGLKNIRYTTGGSVPTASSPVYSGPIDVDATATIKWRAEDNAGNVESPVHTQTITISIDVAQPTSAILCDGAPCLASYDHPVEATLSATDTGGSGVKEIRYTTDGSDPTNSSPVYTAAIPVSATTTIKWRAEDNVGNVEAPAHSQTIQITSSAGGGGGGGPGSAGGTLGAFASSQALSNGTVRLTLEVTGPGELDVADASVAGASAVAAKKRSSRIKPTSQSVAQAGEVTLTIRVSKAGKRILRRKGKLNVPVRVRFTPVTGSPGQLTLRLKFRTSLKS